MSPVLKKILYGTILAYLAVVSYLVFSGSAQNSGTVPAGVNGTVPIQADDYGYINKSVVNNSEKHFIINFLPLKNEFTLISSRYPQTTYVYFAYLNNSSWIGINEKVLFYATSTTKVPLAMAVLRAVEDGKLKLDETYTLDSLDLNEDFGSLYKTGENKTFSVNDLLKIMLEQSDNTAAKALINIFSKIGVDNPLDDVYNSMGWDSNEIGKSPDYNKINLKTLSNMFIALYNANYVNIDHSQLILEELASTPFDNKLVAGVPESIRVSHKVGIADQYQAYSDCGIVYAPNRNYLLCLGSSGADEKNADKFMAEISKAAYDYVIGN